MPSSISKIIIGHSHPECAYNDSLINNFKNFATSGESYFYNYYKVEQLLKQNKHINTLFIEFSNNQINDRMNAWIWEEPYLSKGYKTYGQFIDVRTKVLLAKKNPLGFFNSTTIHLANNLEIIHSKNYDYIKKIGGYKNLQINKVDSLLAYSDFKTEAGLSLHKMSEMNISYLKKIISECEKKKVRVYLIRSPFHEKYPSFKNEHEFQKLRNSDFPELEFLDFKDFPLDNSEYADLEHLNYLGAKKFSIFFNKILQNGLLQKEHKQSYINEVMFNNRN